MEIVSAIFYAVAIVVLVGISIHYTRGHAWLKISLITVFFGCALFIGEESLTRGGLYSLKDGIRYSYSYNLQSREDTVRQLVYKSIGYVTPGIERGGGWSPKWDKIDAIISQLTDKDIPILIGMIDQSITITSANPHKDVSFAVIWVLSKMPHDTVVSQLQKVWMQSNGKSYYLDYGLQMTMEYSEYDRFIASQNIQ